MCAYPKYKTVVLDSYLGSQSICFVGFWISYYGWSYARQAQICFYFLTHFILPHSITYLLSLSVHSIFLVFFPELSTLFLHSLFLFIGKDEWRSYDYFSFLVRMTVQFHHLKVDVSLGRWEWHWN